MTLTTTPAEILEFHKGQFEIFNALGQTAFNAAQKLAELNLAAARAAMQENAAIAQSLLAVRDPQEFLAAAQGAAAPSLEKSVGYARNVYGIVSTTAAEFSRIVEAQISDANRRVAEAIDAAGKSAPAGSETAFSLVKNAVAAANTAFDTATKATRQASDWAESSFAAAASATLQAASSANDAAKGKKAA
jgi:phasin family protein